MKEEKDILKQVAHHDGMTIPEGYFADFASRMADSLPTTEFEASASAPAIYAPRTFWQKVRPYVYMAAMFGGVWCMLKMFTLLTSAPDHGWEPSAIMAEALSNDTFFNDYVVSDVDNIDLMEDMINDGFDLTSFDSSAVGSQDAADYSDNTISI